jgi:hypothetical protein
MLSLVAISTRVESSFGSTLEIIRLYTASNVCFEFPVKPLPLGAETVKQKADEGHREAQYTLVGPCGLTLS